MKSPIKTECSACHSKDVYIDARKVWHCNACEMLALKKYLENNSDEDKFTTGADNKVYKL